MNIPEYVIGFDIETIDVLPSAKVLSMSGVTIKVSNMQIVAVFDFIIDPEDPTQIHRTESYSTRAWHNDFGEESFKPSKESHEITWGGHLKLDAVVKMVLTELTAYRKSDYVITSCGPDFDMVILQDVARYYGVRFNLKYSSYDSVRTAKRGMDALGLPYLTSDLLERFPLLKDQNLKHTSKFDALEEALITARYYNILNHLGKNLDESLHSSTPATPEIEKTGNPSTDI